MAKTRKDIAGTYGSAGEHVLLESLVARDVRVALMGESFRLDADRHEFWSDVAAWELVAPGYVAGGKSLTGKTISRVGSTNVFTAAPLTWQNATIAARFAVLVDWTPATSATRPLIAYFDFGKVMHSDSGHWKMSWDSNGILRG